VEVALEFELDLVPVLEGAVIASAVNPSHGTFVSRSSASTISNTRLVARVR
jgi:hypothetical protein